MNILQRKELSQRLSKVAKQAIILVCAPMGYGKTTAVKGFLEKKETSAVWFSMEGELDEEWMWKKLQKEIYEAIKFNPTEAHSTIPKNRRETNEWVQSISDGIEEPLHIILDDFEWGSSKQIEGWIMDFSHENAQKVCLWIISREDPKGKILELVVKNKAGILKERDFLFTQEEVRQLFQKENIRLEKEEVDFVLQYTNGWAAAIQLVLSSYKEKGNFYNLSALDFLMEAAFFDKVDERLKRHLIKLSILKDFTLEQAEYLCEQQEVIPFLIHMVEKHSFAYKVSEQRYRIAPVLGHMLKRALLLSDVDVNKLRRRAGDWFAENKEYLEAIRQYQQYGDYERIIAVFSLCEEESLMDTAPKLIMNVFKNIPDDYSNEYPYIYMKWIMDIITNKDIKEGQSLLEQYYQKIKAGKINGNKNMLVGEYYFAKAFTQFNDARKMHEYFMKAYRIFQESHEKISRLAYPLMVDTFGSYHMLYLYHNQPGDLCGLVKDINEKTRYFTSLSGGANRGMESQTAAEYAFETGDYLHVEELAIQSFVQAKDGGRSSICICSLFLRGRLGILFLNWELYYKVLEKLQKIYEQEENPIIQCEVDCAMGYLYGMANQYEKIPLWIREGKVENSMILPEASMIFYITYGLSLILAHNYKKLLAISSLMEHTYEHRMHVFGLIYAYIFKTIGYYRLYGLEKAAKSAHELLSLCEKDHIVTPLVEFQNPLNEILEGIIVKNSFFKEVKVLLEKFNMDKSTQNVEQKNVGLTKKEEEVMQYLVLGKRVLAIAELMQISLNTVQTHMKSIYRKYNVNSKIDAIRVYESSRKL